MIDKTQDNVLRYDDNGPAEEQPLRPMLYCNENLYDGDSSCLTASTRRRPTCCRRPDHTSCLFQSLETADNERVDIVYSEVDGLRTLD